MQTKILVVAIDLCLPAILAAKPESPAVSNGQRLEDTKIGLIGVVPCFESYDVASKGIERDTRRGEARRWRSEIVMLRNDVEQKKICSGAPVHRAT